ncbi:hypothetical protein FRC03_005509 [Tulasnella sp. 419]|nr:hypothetical protein FRC03_005509 [Tulasnella sp. 419]
MPYSSHPHLPGMVPQKHSHPSESSTSQSLPPPNLSDSLDAYYIDLKTGFCPPAPPTYTFSDPAYSSWLTLATSIPSLLSSGELYQSVEQLPLLDFDAEDIAEWRLAYVCLAYLAHAYIWGKGKDEEEPSRDTLPTNLSIPLREVSDALGVQPGLTFACLTLWNWKAEDREVSGSAWPWPVSSICTFSGTQDEHHFGITSTRVEKVGGEALVLALEASRAAGKGDTAVAAEKLKGVGTALEKCRVAIIDMKTGCAPDVFYHGFRPFYSGFGNSKFPKGVFYPSEDGGERLKLSGGTAGQSSLFQALDILLGIEHSPDRVKFLESMREAMPGPHVQFLQDIKLLPSIREFVRNSDQRSLTDAYNGALESFKEFRSEHFKLVALYIIGPSKKETKSGKDGEGLVGTGGSDLSSLLKGMRADTLEVKLGKQE